MGISDTIARLLGRKPADDPDTADTVRAIDEGDPTRTIVTDEEPPPIEGR